MAGLWGQHWGRGVSGRTRYQRLVGDASQMQQSLEPYTMSGRQQ